MWHVVLATSGQESDLSSSGGGGVLQFNPVVEEPWKLPVLLVGTIGTIESFDDRYSLTVNAGKTVKISTLSINGAKVSDVTLGPGESVEIMK